MQRNVLKAVDCMSDYAMWKVSPLVEHVSGQRRKHSLPMGSCTAAHCRTRFQGYRRNHVFGAREHLFGMVGMEGGRAGQGWAGNRIRQLLDGMALRVACTCASLRQGDFWKPWKVAMILTEVNRRSVRPKGHRSSDRSDEPLVGLCFSLSQISHVALSFTQRQLRRNNRCPTLCLQLTMATFQIVKVAVSVLDYAMAIHWSSQSIQAYRITNVRL